MKKSMLLLSLIPTLSFAATPKLLPLPAKNSENCYVRTYSKEHLANHPNQLIKGAAVTLANHEGYVYVKTEVRLLDGKAMFNWGGFPTIRPSTRLLGVIDDDGGAFHLIQNQQKQNSVTLKVRDFLYLQEDNYTTNENIPEGTPFESMTIQANTEDSTWILEQVRVNGSIMKTCTQVLDDMIAE